MERGRQERQDCYFYYYSECTKANCQFRHEPAAMGCETMCTQWQQGSCTNEHCNLRHMELKKNRKSIPCFWEMKPDGCTKLYCPFKHVKPRPNCSDVTVSNATSTTTALPSATPATNDWLTRDDDSKFNSSGTDSDQGRGSTDAGSFIGNSSVDTVIVNFEEGMRLY